MKKGINILLGMIIVSFLYGCTLAWIGLGAGVGIGTYKYIEGNLVREYPFSYAQAWDVVNTALENLQISVTRSMDEGTKGYIDAVKKDGKKVRIKLKDKGQGVTSISVRVGILGDRTEAQRIHEEIASVGGIR